MKEQLRLKKKELEDNGYIVGYASERKATTVTYFDELCQSEVTDYIHYEPEHLVYAHHKYRGLVYKYYGKENEQLLFNE